MAIIDDRCGSDRLRRFLNIRCCSTGLNVYRNHVLFESAPFVFLQRRQANMGALCVRTMYGLSVMAEGLLCEPLWIAAFSRTLCPSVAIGMQVHSADLQPFTTLLELRRTV